MTDTERNSNDTAPGISDAEYAVMEALWRPAR